MVSIPEGRRNVEVIIGSSIESGLDKASGGRREGGTNLLSLEARLMLTLISTLRRVCIATLLKHKRLRVLTPRSIDQTISLISHVLNDIFCGRTKVNLEKG